MKEPKESITVSGTDALRDANGNPITQEMVKEGAVTMNLEGVDKGAMYLTAKGSKRNISMEQIKEVTKNELIKEFDLCLEKGISVTIKRQFEEIVVILSRADSGKSWGNVSKQPSSYTAYVADINDMSISIKEARERLLKDV